MSNKTYYLAFVRNEKKKKKKRRKEKYTNLQGCEKHPPLICIMIVHIGTQPHQIIAKIN